MKLIISILIISFGYASIRAQTTNPNLLVNIPKASQEEIDAYNTADLEIGMLVYNTDANTVYEYTNNGFIEFLTGKSTYTGVFIVSATGDQTISGLPFKPSSITMVAHANVETLILDSDNGTSDNDRGLPNSFGTMNGFAQQEAAGITQQVIYVGGHGNSINDISRYASDKQCIGLRYGDQNGASLGKTTASLSEFTKDGFKLKVTEVSDNVVVIYTAYR